MFSKAENIRVPENLLEQRQLSVGVLPVPVEKVHGEETLQALGLKTKLEGFHEQDKTSSVVDAEASVVQLVDNLLPVQCGLQLVHRLDEHLGMKGIMKSQNSTKTVLSYLHIPGLLGGFVLLSPASIRGKSRQGGAVFKTSVGSHHHSNYLEKVVVLLFVVLKRV